MEIKITKDLDAELPVQTLNAVVQQAAVEVATIGYGAGVQRVARLVVDERPLVASSKRTSLRNL